MDEPGKLCVRLRRVRENIRAEVAGELLTADVSAKFEARLVEDHVQDTLVAVPGWQMQEDHKLGLAAPVPAHPVPGQLPHPQLRLSPGGEGRVVLAGGPFSSIL